MEKKFIGGFCICLSFVLLGGCYWAIMMIPKLKEHYADFGVELTASQRTGIMISDLLVSYWYVVVPFVLLLFAYGVSCLLSKQKSD